MTTARGWYNLCPDPTQRYLELIDELGRDMDRPRGWRRRVADQLGIDESTLSKIIAGKRVVGWELAERAVERLKLPGDYFLRDAEPKRPNSSEASSSHRSRATAKLIERLDAGTATVKDVYRVAKTPYDSQVDVAPLPTWLQVELVHEEHIAATANREPIPQPVLLEEHVVEGLEVATIRVQHVVEGLAHVGGLAHVDTRNAPLPDHNVLGALTRHHAHVKPSNQSPVDIRLA